MPTSDLFNQFPNNAISAAGNELPEGIKSIINPSNLSFPAAYEFAKRFVKTETGLSSGGGITSIDDPTYLGFTLLFETDSPLFNGAIIGETEPSANPNQTSPTDPASQLTQAPSGSSEESAVGYLEKIGETDRAKYLRAFVQGIQKINRERPYYWQTIGGLKTAWEKSINFTDDPYVGSSDDEGLSEGITIGCLEAVDLKITALFNLYKLAVYDSQYRRTIIPKNLLYFNVKIFVHEIRKFKTTRNYIKRVETDKNIADIVNGNTSQVAFRLSKCLWKPAESGAVFETVSHTDMQVATTSIKFSYSNILMDGKYSGYSVDLDESGNQRPNLINDVVKGKSLAPYAESQLNGVVDTIEQRGRSYGESTILGNAFGLRRDALGVINNPQGLANALNGAALNLVNEQQGSGSIPQSIGGKIMPEGRAPTNGDGNIETSISSTKIFETPTQNSTLQSSNVFGSKRPSGPSRLASDNIFNENG